MSKWPNILIMLSKFQNDLLEGGKLEDFILSKFKQLYPQSHKIEGNFKPYDIEVPELSQKLECKWDKRSKTTPNIAIEFRDRGKPSGISVTQATQWVYVFWDRGWVFAFLEVDFIKNLCNNEKSRIVRGGDGYQAEMYLFPKTIIKNRKGAVLRRYTKEWNDFIKKHG